MPDQMVTSTFDLEVIFEVKWGHLAFGRILSAERGRMWTNVIKQNIWNFLRPIQWWPHNVTSRSFLVKWGHFQFILLLFPKSKFGPLEHFETHLCNSVPKQARYPNFSTKTPSRKNICSSGTWSFLFTFEIMLSRSWNGVREMGGGAPFLVSVCQPR